MNQFVPADWSTNMGDACAPPLCGVEDGLVELLWRSGHVVMHSQPPPLPKPERAAPAMVHEHEAAPSFQYTALFEDDRSLEKDLFSEIFGEMPAGSDSGGGSVPAPLRAGEASDALPYDDYATVNATSMRPKPPGTTSRSSVKRKQSDTADSPSEVMLMHDAEESNSAAKAVTMRGPKTGERRRAAQEHNLSERRRRDRINEKMRALKELVPHCNKTDKASMLDEAIEYLKSLQLQVQMMWTTGGVTAPALAMFPASGAHRYMHRMASMRSRMPPFRTCVYSSSNGTKK